MEKSHIVVAPGDGIGPEMMDAVIEIMKQAQAPLAYDYIQIGQVLHRRTQA